MSLALRTGTQTEASTKGELMTGELTFFEIGVVDAAPARAFYGGLFGWRIEPGPSAGGYRISTPTISCGMHGGDETLESRTDEPREESFGRFALCRDDQGSSFGLHQPPATEGKGAREPAARKPTIDHVTLRVRYLPASRRFYEAALAPLSLGLEFEHEGLLAFGSGQSGRLIIYASERPVAGFHVAFSAPSREAVDRFHAAALEEGGRDNGAPGLRPEYHEGYYGAYVFDPDGNNVEAVHHTVPPDRTHE
jgi:catechol 2,3-dioxygenase-like lactoylglutathione lyase family enzyme/predicted enzyme related to lactoylglutathione lyase